MERVRDGCMTDGRIMWLQHTGNMQILQLAPNNASYTTSSAPEVVTSSTKHATNPCGNLSSDAAHDDITNCLISKCEH